MAPCSAATEHRAGTGVVDGCGWGVAIVRGTVTDGGVVGPAGAGADVGGVEADVLGAAVVGGADVLVGSLEVDELDGLDGTVAAGASTTLVEVPRGTSHTA